jgi:hypothetical protein
MGYFAVDIWDCVTRLDIPYSFHAICCFILCIANYTIPVCQTLRMTSKAALLEASNPFMHLVKRTRKPLHFVLFAAVYTVCRILWIPYIMYQLRTEGNMTIDNPIFMVLIAFYGLNIFWYSKIVRILFQGGGGGSTNSSNDNASTPTTAAKVESKGVSANEDTTTVLLSHKPKEA